MPTSWVLIEIPERKGEFEDGVVGGDWRSGQCSGADEWGGGRVGGGESLFSGALLLGRVTASQFNNDFKRYNYYRMKRRRNLMFQKGTPQPSTSISSPGLTSHLSKCM